MKPNTLLFALLLIASPISFSQELNQAEQLGKALFFDARLSEPAGQSCSSCHAPQHAFTDPDKSLATSNGIMAQFFGSRNAPTLKYLATIQPRVHIIDAGVNSFSGGLFLDGRAGTLEAQVEGPLLSPIEMGNTSKEMVINKVRNLGYQQPFDNVFGKGALNDDKRAFNFIAAAFASYERSEELNPFSSKYDAWLAGEAVLTEAERFGLKIFEDADKGNCAACHTSQVIDGQAPLLTDFTYDNLGVPFNDKNPFLNNPKEHNRFGEHFIDRGLGLQDSLRDLHHYGKFRIPTLRNIVLTSPYMHNGVFNTLEEVLDFYNTRDVDDKWQQPEIPSTINTEELGDLKLTKEELEALISFLKTLTDGYQI